MNIIVCIKQVPKTENLRLKSGESFTSDGLDKRINLFDTFAIEEALRIKDSLPETTVILLTMGARGCERCLVEGLSLGADKAYLAEKDSALNYDTVSTAHILTSAIRKIEDFEGPADLIFTGTQTTDGSSGVIPDMLSVLTSRELISAAAEVRLTENFTKVEINQRCADRFKKVYRPLPLIISVTKSNREVRFPTFKRIREANQAKINIINSSLPGEFTSATDIIKVIKPGRDSKNSTVHSDDVKEGTQTLLRMLDEDKIFAR